jgi:hypothetical protein
MPKKIKTEVKNKELVKLRKSKAAKLASMAKAIT